MDSKALRGTMRRRISLELMACVAAAPLVLAGAPAFAEEAAMAAAGADASGDGVGLAEVTVTAQKRETNLQQTPIAISVESAEDLANRRVKSLADLMDGSVPSLRIAQFARRNSAFSIGIRGVFPSSDTNQPARDSATGVYIDGVYLGRPQGLGAALFDIERIEVLKGPQGTLFGRNATGGALSIVTREPSGEFKFRQTAGVSNFNGYSSETHIDLPSFYGVAIKIDGLITKRDGVVDNPAQGQPGFNAFDRRGLAIRAKWAPSETFSADYGYDVSYDDTTPSYSQLVEVAANTRLSPLVVVQTNRAEVADIGVPMAESEGYIYGHRLTLRWTPWENTEIRSISAYREIKQSQYDNGAGAHSNPFTPNAQFARYSLAWMHQDQLSQELQLVGSIPRLNYVAGLYYFKETGGDQAWAPNTLQWNATGTGYTQLPSLRAGAEFDFPDRESEAKARSTAAFAQFTWTPPILDDRLRLTAGARYTKDTRSGVLTKVNGLRDGSRFTFKDDRIDPAVSADFDVIENVHAYAKYGTAYRAGGANSRSLTYRPFGPEVIKSAEIGLKSEFWDRRARVNLAAYKTDYEDMQVDFNRNAIVLGSNRTVNETVNVPGVAKIKGFEADITVAPIENLTIKTSYAYTTAHIPPAVNPFNNALTPLNVIYTPRNALNVAIDYTWPQENFEVLFHIDGSAAGGFNSGNNTITSPKTDASLNINARLAIVNFELADGHQMDISLWSRNLLDEEHATAQSFSTASRFRTNVFNDPRSYGIDFTIRY